jgi:hypothetical protein
MFATMSYLDELGWPDEGGAESLCRGKEVGKNLLRRLGLA